ncbi:site-specific integrase [Thalassospiraceae bacterium LMO-JJ14]|nr:site-specific integrase [Thalassospiraceae bacterium LMO-JJ14]
MPRKQSRLPDGLYQRPNSSKFYIDYRVKKTGERIRRSTGTSDLEEAKALLADLTRQKFLSENFDKKPPLPFIEAVNRYAQEQKRDHLKTFMSSARYRLRDLAAWFGAYNAGDITPSVISNYMEERLQRVAPATVRREVSILRAILNKAWRNDLLEVQPRFPRLPKDHRRDRFLSEEEEQRLVMCSPAHLVPIIRFALSTGGRKGEILNLDWRDVDMERGLVTFRETKNGEDRHIPLPRPALAVLASLHPQDHGRVFTYRGRGLSDIKSAFNRARNDAGMPDVRFHDLRHTYASRLVQNGIPLYDAMHLMGHKSLDMVQRYAHLAPDHLRRAVSVLDDYGHTMVTPKTSLGE